MLLSHWSISASGLLVTGKCGIEFDTSQHGQRDLVFPLFSLGLAFLPAFWTSELLKVRTHSTKRFGFSLEHVMGSMSQLFSSI